MIDLDLAFQNEFEYRNSNLPVLNGNILATLFANMVKIGPVTSEIARV